MIVVSQTACVSGLYRFFVSPAAVSSASTLYSGLCRFFSRAVFFIKLCVLSTLHRFLKYWIYFGDEISEGEWKLSNPG